MNLDKKEIHIFRNNAKQTEAPVKISKSEAFACVWDLTQEVFSLSGRYDVKSRLQRHIVKLTRKQG